MRLPTLTTLLYTLVLVACWLGFVLLFGRGGPLERAPLHVVCFVGIALMVPTVALSVRGSEEA